MRRSASGTGYRISYHRQLVSLAAVGAIFWLAMGSWVATANAVEANVGGDAFSSLRGYVQLIATAPAVADTRNLDRDFTKFAQRKSNDGAYAALRSFARRVGADQPPSNKGAQKVAEADNLFDWLRGRQNGTAPYAQPNRTAPAARHSAPVVNAQYVGNKVCLGCHSQQTAVFERTLMGRLLKQGKMQCESCHGPGSEHARLGGGRGVGGIISFRPKDDSRTAEENNAICLGCHEKGARTLWRGSIHQTRDLMCTNCHTIMKAVSRKHQLKTAAQPDTCFQCHKDIRAKFARSQHMPLPEGKMVCTNCHSPHGSYSEHLLKKATVNEVCFQCHAEKRGPFLWEHPPVVESCLNCHDPHGTINENLLVVSRPRLCQRCHNAASRHPANPRNPMSAFAVNRSCLNCHSQIHGSNNPGGQFFHR